MIRALLVWISSVFGQCSTGEEDEERHLERRLVRVERRVAHERSFPMADFVRRER